MAEPFSSIRKTSSTREPPSTGETSSIFETLPGSLNHAVALNLPIHLIRLIALGFAAVALSVVFAALNAGLLSATDADDSQTLAPLLLNALAPIVPVAVVELAFGLGVALSLRPPSAFHDAFVAALLIPLAIAPAVAVSLWTFSFGAELESFAASISPAPIVAAIDIWNHAPLTVLILLTGLRTIPQSAFDAAEFHNLSALESFFLILLPALKPWLIAALIMRLIASFMQFDIAAVLSLEAGGDFPQTLQTGIHAAAILDRRPDRAAVAATFTLIVGVALFFALIRTNIARSER